MYTHIFLNAHRCGEWRGESQRVVEMGFSTLVTSVGVEEGAIFLNVSVHGWAFVLKSRS